MKPRYPSCPDVPEPQIPLTGPLCLRPSGSWTADRVSCQRLHQYRFCVRGAHRKPGLSRDQRRDRDEFRRLSEGDAENFLGFSDLRSTCLQSSDLARGFRKLHSRPLKAAIRQGVTLLIKYQDRLCWAEVIKTHLFPRRQSGLETEAYRVNLFVNLAGSSSSDSNGLRTIEAVPYSEYALRSGELRPQDMLQDLGDNIDLVPVTILAHAVRGVLNGAVGHLYKTPAGFSGSRQYSRWDQVVYRRRNSHYCTAWVLDHEPRSAKVRLWPVKVSRRLCS